LAEVLARTSAGDGGVKALEQQVGSGDSAGRWVEATITGVNRQGPLAGVVWRLRDVTGRRRLDRTQEAQSVELRAALDSGS
jgi:hypothetical protein